MASRDQFQRFLFEHSQVRGAWVQEQKVVVDGGFSSST